MLERLWKGFRKLEPDVCGAELKVGLAIHPGTHCELAANHLGHHRAGLSIWTRNADEMRNHIRQLNQAQETEE